MKINMIDENTPLVLVNGCFDVLHLGHVRMLKAAWSYGQVIVAINSDESIKKLKGNTRPINNQEDRKEFLLLTNLASDVIIFEETNVCEVLKQIKPNIWVKSGYTLETINKDELNLARQLNIELVLLPMLGEFSTTSILNKI